MTPLFVHQDVNHGAYGLASWTLKTWNGHAAYRDGSWAITRAESAGRPITLDSAEEGAILSALESSRGDFAAQCARWEHEYGLKKEAWL